jgi:CheY-like chemotaxis protein
VALVTISILIVDDEVLFTENMRLILEHEGHTIFIANSALEAIGIIERQHIDLAIIDFELGTSLTGIDVARHTKLGTERIMVTGYDPETMRVRWEDPLALFRAILGKPFRMDHLQAVIARVEKAKEDTKP